MREFKGLLDRIVPNKGLKKQIMDQYEKDLMDFSNYFFSVESPTDTILEDWYKSKETVTVESKDITVTNTATFGGSIDVIASKTSFNSDDI